jgi:hypothetical protein
MAYRTPHAVFCSANAGELGGAGSWGRSPRSPRGSRHSSSRVGRHLGYLLCPAQVLSCSSLRVSPRRSAAFRMAISSAATWLMPRWLLSSSRRVPGLGRTGGRQGRFHPRNYSGRAAESKRYYLLRWIRILCPSSCLTVSRMTTRSRNRGGCGNTRRVGRHGRLPRLRPLLESLDT